MSNVSRFKPALNLNRVLADLNRGSNSLNSISGYNIEPGDVESRDNIQLGEKIKPGDNIEPTDNLCLFVCFYVRS